jgi:hypothetical protein
LLHYGKYQRLTGTVPRDIGGRTSEAQGNPGEVLEQRIKENIPTDKRFDITGKVAYGIGWFYNNVICGVGMDAYLPFFAFLVLLLITFLSWVAHTSRKARRRGDPIALRA